MASDYVDFVWRCLMLLVLFPVSIFSQNIVCPLQCSCLGPMVDCSGKKLTKIPPDLPNWMTMLDIQSNDISSISADDFKGLGKLEQIDLSSNNIHYLNVSVFAHLPALKELKLHKNKLTEIPLIKSANITTLILHHNKIKTIQPDTLRRMTTLRVLDLSHNRISRLPQGTFPSNYPLRELYLSNNKISHLETGSFSEVKSLELLKLNRNRISKIPANILKPMKKLKHLDLSKNRIQKIQGLPFEGLTALHTLKLRRNKMSSLSDGIFYGLEGIQELYLDGNNISVVSHKWLFGLNTLTLLTLANNKILRLDADGWKFCKTLKKLDLSSNQMSAIEEGSFVSLNRLQYLDMHNNRISYIANGAFKGLNRLNILDMNSNEISWTLEDTNGAFEELTSLSKLSLEKNHIRSITKRSFRGLLELRELHLTHNAITSVQSEAFDSLMKLNNLKFNSTHFVCDCQASWLPEWLRNHGFLGSVDAKCSLPEWLQGRSIYEIRKNDFQCEDDPKPYIVKQPATRIALKGNNVSLMCMVTCNHDGPMEFKWKKDNSLLRNINGVNYESASEDSTFTFTHILQIPRVRDSDSGNYQCIVSNAYGTAYSQRVKVTVHVFPTFTKTPIDVTVKAGSTARLECAATGQPPPEIRWNKDGGDNFPAAIERRMHVLPNDAVFFIVQTKTSDEGTYSCTATNKAGTIVSNATVTVNEPPSFVKKMEDKVVTMGKTVVLECFAAGSPQPKIRWFKNGLPLHMRKRHFLAAKGQVLLIVASKRIDQGKYSCEMSNTLGKDRGSSQLTIVPPGGVQKQSDSSILDDSTMTTGIIVIAVVCCVVFTSLVWVIIIYQTRKKRREDSYSGAPTDETTLPGDLATPYSTDREDGSTSSVQKYTDIFLDYRDDGPPSVNRGPSFGRPGQQRTAALFPSDVTDEDQPMIENEQALASAATPNSHSQHSITTSVQLYHMMPNDSQNDYNNTSRSMQTFQPRKSGSTSALVQKYNSLPPGGSGGSRGHDRPQIVRSESQSDPELSAGSRSHGHMAEDHHCSQPPGCEEFHDYMNIPEKTGSSTHVNINHHPTCHSSYNTQDTHLTSSVSVQQNHNTPASDLNTHSEAQNSQNNCVGHSQDQSSRTHQGQSSRTHKHADDPTHNVKCHTNGIGTPYSHSHEKNHVSWSPSSPKRSAGSLRTFVSS